MKKNKRALYSFFPKLTTHRCLQITLSFQAIILITLLSSSYLTAQGTLQFNQVLTYGGSAPCNGNTYLSPNLIVPQNKVWKLISVAVSNSNSMRLDLNGITLINTDWREISPFWFKAGDDIRFGSGPTPSGSNTSCQQNIVLSIIEFNIIP